MGAGPTGLALATLLAAGGVEAVLLERADAPHEHSRAAVVHARTLEALEDAGVSDRLVARGLPVPAAALRERDRRLVAIDFRDLPTRYPFALMIPQDATEAVLEERLVELGGRVERGRAVAALDELDARFVVACDGSRSTVREAAGIAFLGGSYPQTFSLADVRLDWPLPPDEIEVFLAPDGLMVVAPLPGGMHRVVAPVERETSPQELLDTRGPSETTRVREVLWSSEFRVHHRLAARFRAGRVFLCGDAAHVHSPAGGQGMNTGIQDAHELASRLVDVLRRGASDVVLDGYETARRPVAERVVRLTDRATRMGTARSRPARLARNGAIRAAGRIPAVRRGIARAIAGV